jgi:hypothetical protein
MKGPVYVTAVPATSGTIRTGARTARMPVKYHQDFYENIHQRLHRGERAWIPRMPPDPEALPPNTGKYETLYCLMYWLGAIKTTEMSSVMVPSVGRLEIRCDGAPSVSRKSTDKQ